MVKKESGQALILVLVFLLVGALIIGLLLNFMATGLKTGQAVEGRILELYAADAGVEDAIWRIMNVPPDELPSEPYFLTVNGKEVEVTIPPQKNIMMEFFEAVGALDPQGEGKYHKAMPHGMGDNPWVVVYSPIESEPGVYDTYRIEVAFEGKGKVSLVNLGCWIQGLYGEDQGAAEVTGVEPDSMTKDFPNFDFYVRTFQGTAFRWEWQPAKGPEFTPGILRTQTFTFSPAIIVEEGQRFPVNVAWAAESRNDIFISWQGQYPGVHHIKAIATSPDTGKSTTVEAYICSEEISPGGPIAITILVWESTVGE